MDEQATLGDVTAGGVERPAVESRTADEHHDGHDTRLLSPASPRLTPEGHKWAGTRAEWCSDCNDAVGERHQHQLALLSRMVAEIRNGGRWGFDSHHLRHYADRLESRAEGMEREKENDD